MLLSLPLTATLTLNEVQSALAVLPRGILYMELEKLQDEFKLSSDLKLDARYDDNDKLYYAIVLEGKVIGNCRQYARENGRAFWQSYVKGADARIRTYKLPEMYRKLAKAFQRRTVPTRTTEDLL